MKKKKRKKKKRTKRDKEGEKRRIGQKETKKVKIENEREKKRHKRKWQRNRMSCHESKITRLNWSTTTTTTYKILIVIIVGGDVFQAGGKGITVCGRRGSVLKIASSKINAKENYYFCVGNLHF